MWAAMKRKIKHKSNRSSSNFSHTSGFVLPSLLNATNSH